MSDFVLDTIGQALGNSPPPAPPAPPDPSVVGPGYSPPGYKPPPAQETDDSGTPVLTVGGRSRPPGPAEDGVPPSQGTGNAPTPTTAQPKQTGDFVLDTIGSALAGSLAPSAETPQPPPQPPQPTQSAGAPLSGVPADMVQGLGSGVEQGAIAAAGAPRDASDALDGGISYLLAKGAEGLGLLPKGKTAEDFVSDAHKLNLPRSALSEAFSLPGGGDIRDLVQKAAGPFYEPKTVPGQFAKTVGEFLPVAAGAPVTGALLPGIADEAAGQMTKGTGLEGPARLVGAVAGGATGLGARGLTNWATSGTPAVDAAQAAGRLGVDMPSVALSNNPVVQGVGSALKSLPIGGTPIRQGAEKAIGQIGDAAQAAAEMPTGTAATMEDAGRTMRGGLENYIGPVSKGKVGQLYDQVDRFVKPNVTTDLGSTRNVVADIAAQRQAAAMQGNGKATDTVLDAVQRPGGLSYQGIKTLRSSVGEMLKGGILPEGMSQAELKRIYGGLSDDLKTSVQNAGGAAGKAAFERANRYAGLVAQRREDLARILRAPNDEGIAGALQRLAGSNSAADASLLTKARKAVYADEWNQLSSAVIGKLGKSPTGEFSPDRFLSDYAKLSPRGKDMLFNSTGQVGLRNSLDDIATVSQRFKQLAKFGNPSGTTQTAAGLGELGAIAKSLVSGTISIPLEVAGGLLGAHSLASALGSAPKAATIARWQRAYAAVAAHPTPQNLSVYKVAARSMMTAVGGVNASAQSGAPVLPRFAPSAQQTP